MRSELTVSGMLRRVSVREEISWRDGWSEKGGWETEDGRMGESCTVPLEAMGSGCGEVDMEVREVDVTTVVVRAAGLAVETETFRRRDLNFVLFNSRAAFASC